MNEGLIAKRYAKALFEYAASRGEDKRLYERMRQLSRNLSAVPRIREFMLNPVLHREDKAKLIIDAAGGDVEPSFARFVRLLLDNKREVLLQSVALSYMSLYRKEHRITVVWLVSAEPMPEFILERIRLDVERRTRGPVEMETRTDESIKGGFIFQIDDLRLDASVAGQLNSIKQQFLSRNRAII